MPRHLFQVTVNLPASFRNNLNNNEVFNPYLFVRNRLYHFVFNRFALLYARLFSEAHRKLFEFFVLLTALFCFIILVYVHVVFVHTPITCLENYRNVWQNNGILRVEVLALKGKENYTLEDSYWKEKTLRLQQYDGQSHFFYTDHSVKEEKEEVVDIVPAGRNESMNEDDPLDAFNTFERDGFTYANYTPAGEHANYSPATEDFNQVVIAEENFQPISEESILASDPDGAYIMEFSLEYGYLRLRPTKRKELNISVTFVVLDPEENKCFGGSFNRFLLSNFLGYDNVLLASIKNMAERKDQKGFVRNAVMEIEYIFINNWTNEKSYFTAGFVMIIFTLTISTLLRHSHHQIFIVVGFWMHHIISSMERRSNFFDVVWPRNLLPTSGAPVLTVILALVGMEAVMSDFFHDRSIALHVIVIVWFADLYDAVCCQSTLSKRHWFRFFYLYHFLFYAYNYKFSGVYWPLTLLTSWLFTFHSMVFFFHHYELPRFLHRAARFNITINQSLNQPPQNNPPDNPPPSNQDSAAQPPQPPDEPENSGDDQSNDGEQDHSDSQDQSPAVENLVTEGTVSAAGYDYFTSSPVEMKSKINSKCCDHCHSLQVKSLSDTQRLASKEIADPISPVTECCLQCQNGGLGFLKSSNNGLKAVMSLNKHQTCEPQNSKDIETMKGKILENHSKLCKDIQVGFSQLRKKDPGQYLSAGKGIDFLHPSMENDLYSRELKC